MYCTHLPVLAPLCSSMPLFCHTCVHWHPFVWTSDSIVKPGHCKSSVESAPGCAPRFRKPLCQAVDLQTRGTSCLFVVLTFHLTKSFLLLQWPTELPKAGSKNLCSTHGKNPLVSKTDPDPVSCVGLMELSVASSIPKKGISWFFFLFLFFFWGLCTTASKVTSCCCLLLGEVAQCYWKLWSKRYSSLYGCKIVVRQ